MGPRLRTEDFGSYQKPIKVSIIIPLYNQAEFVGQAIESALAQTYGDTEIIVVNDGSTDASYMVANRYSVTVINQSNKGLAGARNAGVLNSSGDAILPLDADDWIDPEYLRKTVPLLTEGIGFVSTDMQYFGIQDFLIPAKTQSLWQEMRANEIPVCSLIRREAFLQTGGYNGSPSIRAYEDWNLWVDILKRGWRMAIVNEPLFYYRRHPESMSEGTAAIHERLHNGIKKLHPELPWDSI